MVESNFQKKIIIIMIIKIQVKISTGKPNQAICTVTLKI